MRLSKNTLIYAAILGDLPTINKYIKKGLTNYETVYGETPLSLAASHGHLECVKALIQAGADVNHRNNEGYTAIWWASRNKHSEIVNALLMQV